MFIVDEVYTWQALDELATCAHAVGDIHVGYAACKKLLEDNYLPDEQKSRVAQNFSVYTKLVSEYQSMVTQDSLTKELESKMKKKKDKLNKREKVKKPTKVESRRQKAK